MKTSLEYLYTVQAILFERQSNYFVVSGCACSPPPSSQGKEILLATPHGQEKGQKGEIMYENRTDFMFLCIDYVCEALFSIFTISNSCTILCIRRYINNWSE